MEEATLTALIKKKSLLHSTHSKPFQAATVVDTELWGKELADFQLHTRVQIAEINFIQNTFGESDILIDL